jgi:hypothetical protein
MRIGRRFCETYVWRGPRLRAQLNGQGPQCSHGCQGCYSYARYRLAVMARSTRAKLERSRPQAAQRHGEQALAEREGALAGVEHDACLELLVEAIA